MRRREAQTAQSDTRLESKLNPTKTANKITPPNAGGLPQFATRTRSSARVGEFRRWAPEP
jgi:hypothetical protein